MIFSPVVFPHLIPEFGNACFLFCCFFHIKVTDLEIHAFSFWCFSDEKFGDLFSFNLFSD